MPIKILQITNKPAYPSIDGGCLGMAKMSNFYNQHPDYSLDIITLETYKHPFNPKAFEKALSSNVTVTNVPVNTKPNLFGAIKSLFLNKSYNLARFKSSLFKENIKEVLTNNDYDFIQLENIFVAQYIDLIKKLSSANIILNSANIEYEIWERLAKKSTGIKKIYFQILSKQLKSEEEIIWAKTDGIICATHKDKATIAQIVKAEKLVTLPFFLDITLYPVIENHRESLNFFHLGAMDWIPNVEGLEWFVGSIWNNIETSSVLHLAGKDMPASFFQFSSNNIEVTGFVDDAIEYMNQFEVMIVPLLSGSGIRVKIIEAMALGKCIISTSIGAEGINYTHQENIWIANTEEEFKTAINQLIQQPEIAYKIGRKARKLIEKEYDISLMKPQLTQFLCSLNPLVS